MDDKLPAVDIVVCAYKNRELTDRCLTSLFNLNYPHYKVFLVDDCSADGSVGFFKNKYPDLSVIENEKCLGPARARNIGIAAGGADYLVTLDNDAFLSPDWLGQMVELMESDRSIGQAVGKILFADNKNKIAAAGGSAYFRGKGYDIGFGADVSENKYNRQREVLYACSASMIVRRNILDLVGGFDDIYYHGYEDTDLSFKINLAGYKVTYYPFAISYHGLSKTVDQTINTKRSYYSIRNRLLLIFKNCRIKSLIKCLSANIKFTICDCRRHPERIIAVLKSWSWIALHFFLILKKRGEVNKFRKVNDKKIHLLFNLN
ncbi:MAG: glycosyltransferase family 2 protein [Patescibacteria group bacterium]